MRTLTAAQTTALASRFRTVRFRVFVDITGAGVFQDLTNFQGYDWVQSVSYDESVDQNVAACTVTLARNVFRLSLSPLMSASKLNNGAAALAVGRRLYVETMTTVIDMPYSATDWVRVFDGYIEDLDPAGETITLSCLDLGALLTDTYIETERNYGSALGTPVNTVMQAIINDNINTPGLGNVTLYTPVVPTFLLQSFTQDKVTVADALTKLADQIGHSVRYKWDSGTGAFRLTLYQPDRAKVTPDYTFGPNDYTDVGQLAISRKDVRNVVQVVFDDKTTSNVMRNKVQLTDTASVSAYGRRFMEIAEASTSQIDTTAEATTMAQAALSDLSTPYAEQIITLPYFFAAEVGDLYAFSPNYKHYDTTQKSAVVSIKHELTADGKCTTAITTRGKPATGYRRWLRIEGRPGVSPNAGFMDPATPGAVNAYAALGSLVVEYTPPDTARWNRTEVFLDVAGLPLPSPEQVSGKYVALPAGLRVASGKQTRFAISGLVPGKTYYGRVQVVDIDGNRSAASGQFSLETQRAAAYHANTDTAGAVLNPNPDFNAFTRGTNTFPDAWQGVDTNSTWGPNQTVYFDTAAASGKFCVVLYSGCGGLNGLPQAGGGGICTAVSGDASALIPMAGGDILSAVAWFKWAALPAGITNRTASLALDFYSSTGGVPTLIPGARREVVEQCTGATGWGMGFVLTCDTPSEARWVAVSLYRNGQTPAPASPGNGNLPGPWGNTDVAPQLYIDRITLSRGRPFIESYGTKNAATGDANIDYQYVIPDTSVYLQLWEPYDYGVLDSQRRWKGDPNTGSASSAGFDVRVSDADGDVGNGHNELGATFIAKARGSVSVTLTGELKSLNSVPTSGSIVLWVGTSSFTQTFTDLAQNQVIPINITASGVKLEPTRTVYINFIGIIIPWQIGGTVYAYVTQNHEVRIDKTKLRLQLQYEARDDL